MGQGRVYWIYYVKFTCIMLKYVCLMSFAPLCLEPSRCNMCHNIFAFLYWNVFRFYCLSKVHEWYSQLHYSVWYLLILCLLFYCANCFLKLWSHLLLSDKRFSHANFATGYTFSCELRKLLGLKINFVSAKLLQLLTIHNGLFYLRKFANVIRYFYAGERFPHADSGGLNIVYL